MEFVGVLLGFEVLLALDDGLRGDFGGDLLVLGLPELKLVELGLVVPADVEGGLFATCIDSQLLGIP